MVKRVKTGQAAAEGLYHGGASRGVTDLPEEFVRRALVAESGNELLDSIIEYLKENGRTYHQRDVNHVLTQLESAVKIHQKSTDQTIQGAAKRFMRKLRRAATLLHDKQEWPQIQLRHNPNVQKAEQIAVQAAAGSVPAQPTTAPPAPPAPTATPAQLTAQPVVAAAPSPHPSAKAKASQPTGPSAKPTARQILQAHGKLSKTPIFTFVATTPSVPQLTAQPVVAAAPSLVPQLTATQATLQAAPSVAPTVAQAVTQAAAPAAAQTAAQAATPSRWQQLRGKAGSLAPLIAAIIGPTIGYALGYYHGQQTPQTTTNTQDLLQLLQQRAAAEAQLRARQQAYWNDLFRSLLTNQIQLYRSGMAPPPQLPTGE